jgi:hypothetical protein
MGATIVALESEEMSVELDPIFRYLDFVGARLPGCFLRVKGIGVIKR